MMARPTFFRVKHGTLGGSSGSHFVTNLSSIREPQDCHFPPIFHFGPLEEALGLQHLCVSAKEQWVRCHAPAKHLALIELLRRLKDSSFTSKSVLSKALTELISIRSGSAFLLAVWTMKYSYVVLADSPTLPVGICT